MKENQTESCQKCLLIKIQESHKKALGTDLIKKGWLEVLKIDACADTNHKMILSWSKTIYYRILVKAC